MRFCLTCEIRRDTRQDMSKETDTDSSLVQVSFRLPKSMVAELDERAVKMAADGDGVRYTRTDVLRILTVRALAETRTRGRK